MPPAIQDIRDIRDIREFPATPESRATRAFPDTPGYLVIVGFLVTQEFQATADLE